MYKPARIGTKCANIFPVQHPNSKHFPFQLCQAYSLSISAREQFRFWKRHLGDICRHKSWTRLAEVERQGHLPFRNAVLKSAPLLLSFDLPLSIKVFNSFGSGSSTSVTYAERREAYSCNLSILHTTRAATTATLCMLFFSLCGISN